MRVIIVGAGEVGYHVANRLAKEEHDVVVVDVDQARLDYVESHLDVAVIEGSGASPAALERAGIREAGLLLAVSDGPAGGAGRRAEGRRVVHSPIGD